MKAVPHIGSDSVRNSLPMAVLIDALSDAFAAFDTWTVPDRHHHSIDDPRRESATLLLMPAWRSTGSEDDLAGVKIAGVFPSNTDRGLPSVSSIYVLMSASTGRILATIDGAELTRLRTAAASAAAASRLARADAGVLLMVGAGALAEPLIRAHSAVRNIKQVLVWNRTRGRAQRLADSLGGAVSVAYDLDEAVSGADIVSCATMSKEPLVRSAVVRPGTHVDLVGAYRPDMREADSDLVRRAEIFVDTRSGALSEAGDLSIPVHEGVLHPSDVRGDLFDLCSGRHPGRRSADEITLFKSVGHALEDLVAASLVYDAVNRT